ncbi:MAG: hypothetical protein ACYC3L_01175 [Gemmatimonadaceae bacterium]
MAFPPHDLRDGRAFETEDMARFILPDDLHVPVVEASAYDALASVAQSNADAVAMLTMQRDAARLDRAELVKRVVKMEQERDALAERLAAAEQARERLTKLLAESHVEYEALRCRLSRPKTREEVETMVRAYYGEYTLSDSYVKQEARDMARALRAIGVSVEEGV